MAESPSSGSEDSIGNGNNVNAETFSEPDSEIPSHAETTNSVGQQQQKQKQKHKHQKKSNRTSGAKKAKKPSHHHHHRYTVPPGSMPPPPTSTAPPTYPPPPSGDSSMDKPQPLPNYMQEERSAHEQYCWLCVIGRQIMLLNKLTETQRFIRDLWNDFDAKLRGKTDEAELEEAARAIYDQFKLHQADQPNCDLLRYNWSLASIRGHGRFTCNPHFHVNKDLNRCENLLRFLENNMLQGESLNSNAVQMYLKAIDTRQRLIFVLNSRAYGRNGNIGGGGGGGGSGRGGGG